MKIQENIVLSKYTTWRIGGPARYFVKVNSNEELIKAVHFAKTKKLPLFILGHGSNILVSDKGFQGLIIKNECQKHSVKDNVISAEGGLSLTSLLKISYDHNLSGIDWLAGIPSTLAGAVRGNAGAFGHSLQECVLEVESLDNNLKVIKRQGSDLNFQYRHSIFKDRSEIILSVRLKLKKQKPDKKIVLEYLKTRSAKQPLNFPSAGCVFRNPKPQSAGALIEQCGLMGKQIGQAQVSDKHANFIVNLGPSRQQPGGAKASDVLKLIKEIKQEVKHKCNILLKEEIQYL